MKNKKIIIALIVVVVVIGVWFSLSSPEEGPQTDNKYNNTDSKEKKLPDKELSEINFSIYNQNKTIKWNLDAENVKQFADKSLLKLNPIKIKVYNIKNEKELLYTFQADRAKYLSDKGSLDIEGPVSIKRDKINLTLDNLNWQSEEDRITGDKVKFSNPNYSLNGARFEANSKLNHLIFYGDEKSKASFAWEENSDETD